MRGVRRMEKYTVTGMSCAACSARVEKAVSAIDGVEECTVNLLTSSMNVSGTADEAEIIAAVEAAGYGAFKANGEKKSENKTDSNDEFKKTTVRLISSLAFLAVLMYFSMGHMLSLPVPAFAQSRALSGLIQLLLSATIFVINQKFFINGFKGVIHRSPNMDTLVSLGSGAAFCYSVYSLFKVIAEPNAEYDFYFESAAMILTLITVGKMLEARSKGKTADALGALMKLAPDTAHIIRDGKEITVSADEIKKGDIFTVRPGESIPADGTVIEGFGTVNESALTGESVPVDKAEGDGVSAGTVNGSGFLKCSADKTGDETFLAQIIRTVSDASASKAPIARVADKVSAIFVPVVILIAVITFVLWLILGESTGFAVARAVSVLVISCPCALGLATPVAIMVGSGVGAKNGILFKTAAALEETGKIKTVIFDKTGTLTKGELEVTDIVSDEISENEFLRFAYALEKPSEHPVAAAVIREAERKNIVDDNVECFKALAGCGVEGIKDGAKFTAGKPAYIKTVCDISDKILSAARNAEKDGKTVLIFAKDKKSIGLIALSDTLKSDSAEAVETLHSMGIKTVMLTGDNSVTASVIAKQAKIDEVIADVLPDEKEKAVAGFMKKGKTAMVGDGINDAPALTRADIGIAIGAGTDAAIDSADVVLLGDGLFGAVNAVKLGRAVLRNIKENLFWAFFYNIIGIPVAAGVFIKAFGLWLNPMLAAAAMSLSSFCVVTNALRLNRIKLKNNNPEKENFNMKKTIKIEGMMCMHCEARVKTALEALEGVDSAEVSHEKGTAVVTLSKDVPDDFLKETVEVQGYKVV